MTTRLRAGVLGLGMMGRHHVRVLSTLSGVELVAVADRDGDPHGAGAAAGVPVLSHLAELIAVGLDMCVVSVPTADHAPAALELAMNGVATLIEKPLAIDSDTAAELVAAFRSAGVFACVGHVERFNPALLAMRTRLAAGEIGDVFQIATRRLGPFPDRIRDVGVVKDLATHDLDLTRFVTGSPYTTVTARAAHRSGRPFEDLVSVLGALADGTITNHLVNWVTPSKERRVIVTGEGGLLEADLLTADLTHYANGSQPTAWDALSSFRGVSEGDVIRYAIPKPEPIRSELSAFRDSVLGVGNDSVSVDDGLLAVRVAEAVLESARSGSTVHLDPA